jgi:hypothetical protein
MKSRLIKLFSRNGKTREAYEEQVNALIRARYSLPQELAILRQRDEKPEEYAAYNAYAEECKIKAKAIVFGEV